MRKLRLERTSALAQLFGDSWRSEDVLKRYQRASAVEEFLAYAVKSTGDWLIYDPTKGIIITAPGFSGAYLDTSQKVVGRDVGPLVRDRLKKNVPIFDQSASSWWLSRDIGPNINAYPVSSPFSNIRSLVGASIVHFDGDTVRCEGYLNHAPFERYPASTFEESLLTASANVNRPVCLMFSGGKDCLSIAVALQEAGFDSSNLRLAYVASGCIAGEKGVRQAEIGARSTEIELEVIRPEGGWWAWGGDAGAVRIRELMSRTIIEPFSPFHCISDIGKNELLIDGQNMDAMLSMDMSKPPQKWPSIFGSASFWYLYLFRDVLRNFRYTSHFQRSRLMRSATYRLEAMLKLIYRAAGTFKSYKPAAVSKMKIYEQLAALQRKIPLGSIDPNLDYDWEALKLEAEKLAELGGNRTYDSWFYMYPAMAAMLGHGQHTHVNRFVNQGPFAPLWRRGIGLMEAVSPKYEVRRFLKRKLAKTYAEAIDGLDTDTSRVVKNQVSMPYSELLQFGRILNWRDSAVMDHLSPETADQMKSDLERIVNVDDCRADCYQDRMERKIRFRQGLRFINLECILRGGDLA